MTTKEKLEKLRVIAESTGRTKISEVGVLNGKTVYQMSLPNLLPRAKVGYPVLYYFVNGAPVELTHEQVRKVIRQELCQRGGKRLQ